MAKVINTDFLLVLSEGPPSVFDTLFLNFISDPLVRGITEKIRYMDETTTDEESEPTTRHPLLSTARKREDDLQEEEEGLSEPYPDSVQSIPSTSGESHVSLATAVMANVDMKRSSAEDGGKDADDDGMSSDADHTQSAGKEGTGADAVESDSGLSQS